MKLVALVDCNNFFVSCERIFNPTLRNRPVVVLSNNDGCVVARSNEAKALGIRMGAPAFTYKSVFIQHNVAVLSSNFELYGDISARVMKVLQDTAPEVFIYSIDEAFLDLSDIPSDYVNAYVQHIRHKVKQWTGIPISIGIGHTKTLAKIANKIAKKYPEYQGVCNSTIIDMNQYLHVLDVSDVWGIGRQYTKLLHRHGITTVKQFMQLSDAWVRKHMTVSGLKTLWELQGKACIEFDDIDEMNNSIVCSRSFGSPITKIEDLKYAVATYVSRAAEKLREQKACASMMTVFARTSRFIDEQQRYAGYITCPLLVPTSYTPDLIHHALQGVDRLFQPGYVYKKAGVMLYDIVSEKHIQLNVFNNAGDQQKKYKAMNIIDAINNKWPYRICFAAAGTKQPWKSARVYRSKHFTTLWEDVLVVKN